MNKQGNAWVFVVLAFVALLVFVLANNNASGNPPQGEQTPTPTLTPMPTLTLPEYSVEYTRNENCVITVRGFIVADWLLNAYRQLMARVYSDRGNFDQYTAIIDGKFEIAVAQINYIDLYGNLYVDILSTDGDQVLSPILVSPVARCDMANIDITINPVDVTPTGFPTPTIEVANE